MKFPSSRQGITDSIRHGERYIHLGEFTKGIDFFTLLLEDDPKNVRALLKRSRCYDGICYQEARDADFETILQLAPDGPEGQLVRGLQIRWEAGLRELARAHFTAAIQLDPTFPEAYENRGQLYYFNDEFRPAIQDFTDCLQLVPIHANVRYFRASAYQRLGDYLHSAQDLEAFLEFYPTTIMRERLCREIAACWFALAEMAAQDRPPLSHSQKVWREFQVRNWIEDAYYPG